MKHNVNELATILNAVTWHVSENTFGEAKSHF